MARTRRSTQDENHFEIVSEEPGEGPNELGVSGEAPQDVVPLAREDVRVVSVKTFSRNVPVNPEEGESEQPPELPPTPAPAVATESEIPPHIERFLKEMGNNEQGWQMVVYRLPTYAKDGRTDVARRKLCGVIEFTVDYEFEIQARYARVNKQNYFLVVVKKRGAYVKGGTLPVFSCEPLPVEEQIEMPGDAQPQQQQQQPSGPVYQDTQDIVLNPPPADPVKAIKQQLEIVKMMREAFGVSPEPAASAPQLDPDTAFLKALASNTNVVERIAKGSIGKLLGDGAGQDRNEWAEVAMELVKTGQAAQVISSAIGALFMGFGNLMPRSDQAPAPPAPPAAPVSPPQGPHSSAVPPIPPTTAAPVAPAAPAGPAPSIELQVLGLALDACQQNLPPRIAADRIIAIAERVRIEAPANAIDAYLDMFASMSTVDALALVGGLLPDRVGVTQLPHANAWTAELQHLLKSEGEE